MKLLYCQVCGDIIAPDPQPRKPRWCRVGCHAVWWVDPVRGILRVHERDGVYRPLAEGEPPEPTGRGTWARKASPHRAWVLGVHNDFLTYGHEQLEWILSTTPESMRFKSHGTLVVRVRPGESTDTDWSELLPEIVPEA